MLHLQPALQTFTADAMLGSRPKSNRLASADNLFPEVNRRFKRFSIAVHKTQAVYHDTRCFGTNISDLLVKLTFARK